MGAPLAYPGPVVRLIEEFAKLPGIGKRTAERMAFHILSTPRDEAMALALAVRDCKNSLKACSRCFNIAEGELCPVCADPARDPQQICVTELPRDAIAIEKTGIYSGVYHILQGRISPSEGRAPSDLRIPELEGRIAEAERAGTPVREVILAVRPNAEGDATAEFVHARLAEKFPALAVTRLARGLASGTDMDNAAASSIMFAFQGRKQA